MNKVLIFEANEFNFDLMSKLANQYQLENLKKLVSFDRIATKTDDQYDSGFLEPWSQWVSVHTGVPASEHQIKHLGDVPNLKNKQIWELLSDSGYSVGVWGVMNGSRNNAKNCKFFLPDPWTYTEPGFPESLNILLDLPRYLAKNYLDVSSYAVLKKSFSFFFSLFSTLGSSGIFWKELARAINALFKFGPRNFIFISLFDVISTLYFFRYRAKFETHINFLFLNSLAHVQHHYWSDSYHERLVYSYRVFDEVVGIVLNNLGAREMLFVLNALTQKNTNDEPPWILYRQKDPKKFFTSVGVQCAEVEQLMTHDSHLMFANENEAKQGLNSLFHATIEGKRLFFCEPDPINKNKLFVRVDFFDHLSPNAVFTIDTRTFSFFDFFESIVTRTGKHVPRGDILTNLQDSRLAPMYNHEFYNYLTNISQQ